jgi:hypothetical protein
MKGRARQIFRDFQAHAAATGNTFGVCRVILLARVVPEKLSEDLDDPDLEARLEGAIRTLTEGRQGSLN